MTEFFASYWPAGYPTVEGPKSFKVQAETLEEAVSTAQIELLLHSLTAILADVVPVVVDPQNRC